MKMGWCKYCNNSVTMFNDDAYIVNKDTMYCDRTCFNKHEAKRKQHISIEDYLIEQNLVDPFCDENFEPSAEHKTERRKALEALREATADDVVEGSAEVVLNYIDYCIMHPTNCVTDYIEYLKMFKEEEEKSNE